MEEARGGTMTSTNWNWNVINIMDEMVSVLKFKYIVSKNIKQRRNIKHIAFLIMKDM